jgi:hypothetical protein
LETSPYADNIAPNGFRCLVKFLLTTARDEDVCPLLDEERGRSEAYSCGTISNNRRSLVICVQSLPLPSVLPAWHDEVQDVHQHGLVVLVQSGRSDLYQTLLRTGF